MSEQLIQLDHELRILADEAWAMGEKELSTELHGVARRFEKQLETTKNIVIVHGRSIQGAIPGYELDA